MSVLPRCKGLVSDRSGVWVDAYLPHGLEVVSRKLATIESRL